MVFLKVLGNHNNYKNKISIFYKINQGYFEKKLSLNLKNLSKKNSNHYNKIFLKYFENKPFYIF